MLPKVQIGSHLFTLTRGRWHWECHQCIGSIEDAKEVFDRKLALDVVFWNTMIAGYAQHGYGKHALQHFEKMQCVGLKPNCTTFVSVLSACSHAGLMDEGYHHFNSMGPW